MAIASIFGDPFADGILNLSLNDEGETIRRPDGTRNSLEQDLVNLGAAGAEFRPLSRKEFEDNIQSPAGVAFDAAGERLLDLNGNEIFRQPIPIFSQEEAQFLNGMEVEQPDGSTITLMVREQDPTRPSRTSNDLSAPFVLVNPPDRPSAREISNSISVLGPGESIPNPNGVSSFLWSFGQLVNHTTDLVREGFEETNTDRELNLPILVPEDDPTFSFQAFLDQAGGDEAAARALIEATAELKIIEDDDGNEVLGDNGLPLTEFEFERDAFAPETGVLETASPGEAINVITSWLDLSSVYGSGGVITEAVRDFGSNGRLRVFPDETVASNDDLLPVNNVVEIDGELVPVNPDEQAGEQLAGVINAPSNFMGVGFLAGDIRVTENDSLAAEHTVWVRNHNRIAHDLAEAHPDWTDDQIFQRARQINIAQFQNIVLNEWTPVLAGDPLPYQGYNPEESPEIADFFAIAALRVGHTLVNEEIQFIDVDGNVETVDIANAFGAPNIDAGIDVDNLFRGLSVNLSEDIDTNVIDGLRNLLIPGAIGSDLLAGNQQRGRDRGLADGNQAIVDIDELTLELGVQRVESFEDLTNRVLPGEFTESGEDEPLADILRELYLTIEDVDAQVFAFAQSPVPGLPSGAGLALADKLREQYERIRDSDRFWFENPIGGEEGGFFTEEEIEDIRQVTFADILELNTEIDSLQNNLFFVPDADNPVSARILEAEDISSESANVTVSRLAGNRNTVGFYALDELTGNPVDNLGSFAATVVASWQIDANLDADLPGSEQTRGFETFTNVNLDGRGDLAAFLIQDGTVDDFVNGTAEAFFVNNDFNSDGLSHIKELGSEDGTFFKFVFEDLMGAADGTGADADFGASDRDFNDAIIEIDFAA